MKEDWRDETEEMREGKWTSTLQDAMAGSVLGLRRNKKLRLKKTWLGEFLLSSIWKVFLCKKIK